VEDQVEIPALAPLSPGEVREYRIDAELQRPDYIYQLGFRLKGGPALAVVRRPRIEPGRETSDAREIWERAERLRPALHGAERFREGELPSPDKQFVFRAVYQKEYGGWMSLHHQGERAAINPGLDEMSEVNGFLWVPGRPHSLLFADGNGLTLWEGEKSMRQLEESPSVKEGIRLLLGVTRDGREAVYLHFPFDETEGASLRFLCLPSPRPSND
jgi:hypothetical protein